MSDKLIELFIETQIGQEALNFDNATKIELLKKRFRRLIVIMVVNLVFVGLFVYSFYYGITQLSNVWLNFILLFFGLNVVFLGIQWKKLNQAIDYLSRT